MTLESMMQKNKTAQPGRDGRKRSGDTQIVFVTPADWRLQQGRGRRPSQPVASCGGLGGGRGGRPSKQLFLPPPPPPPTIPPVSFFRMCLICCSCLVACFPAAFPSCRPGPYLRHYSAVQAGATEPPSQPFLPVSAQIHASAGWEITC